MTQPDRFFSPKETARRLGVSVKALRVYEAQGLVRPARTQAGWRAYGPRQMERLHQVLALKRIGLPLKRIGELLAGRLADLDAVLAVQETAVRLRRAEADRALALLGAARARLARGQSLSVDEMMQLTRQTAMSEDLMTRDELQAAMAPLAAKYLTPQERAQMAEREAREGEGGQAQWGALITEAAVALARGVEPTSAEAMDLARRWMALTGRFTGGDPAVNRKVRDMWREACQDPAFRDRAPTSPRMMSFIREAYGAAIAAGVVAAP